MNWTDRLTESRHHFTRIPDQSEPAKRAGELGDPGADVLVEEHVAHEEDVEVAVDRGPRPAMKRRDA